MATEVRADPVELARLAQSYLDTSRDLFDALRDLRSDCPLSPSDFGALPSSGALAQAYSGVTGNAGTALERLTAVMEVDSESLYRVAFAYRQADEEAERKLRQKHRNIPL